MPLNKLENFIKNTEGRILYVNPNDIDATDSISNQGNSLAQPFKTIQRALLESARFSYVEGNNNDIIEKTTILLFPGEHVVDNRPGFGIKSIGGTAKAVAPDGSGSNGAESDASETLSLNLTTVFDLTQEDNILYKFNSINGGVIVPRGTSIVGLDLRKTKVRPKYVPNPTDEGVASSAIFRITGTCYFWQFSIFDGDENGLVFTDSSNFSVTNRSKPTFSHHKLTCFEYADGVNVDDRFALTDLQIYYSKLSNAFNKVPDRTIKDADKFPANLTGFSAQRPEFEIVGAFASDPINISNIISGDGSTPTSIITVTTSADHTLTTGTPIKIKGIEDQRYNISTKVQSVTGVRTFTYLLPFVPDDLNASPSSSSGTATIETDTVSGASPYIFNISLRSVFGMNGMHADGSKATGFRSMVVAQFTAISLQKDDRCFKKYDPESRTYKGITLPTSPSVGSELATLSSSQDPTKVFHLDSGAVYRKGFETSHIKLSNDAIMQIVSVFAIGFNKHFNAETGADASVTNSNSNFGQFAIACDGFKKDAFAKDDAAFITQIIAPKEITSTETNVDWQRINVDATEKVGISSHLYLFGFDTLDNVPPTVIQGYRVGAAASDRVFVDFTNTNAPSGTGIKEATIRMNDLPLGSGTKGTTSSIKEYKVTSGPTSNSFTIGTHELITGEKVRILSDSADLPENLEENTVYFAIVVAGSPSNQIKLASSKTNADLGVALIVHGGTKLKIQSRVSDKSAGDIGSPLQFDSGTYVSQFDEPLGSGNFPTLTRGWYLLTNPDSELFKELDNLNGSGGIGAPGANGLGKSTPVSFIKRTPDERSLDEKIYKIRVVVPKESANAKNPEEGFIIQESSTTGIRSDNSKILQNLNENDYDYKRNTRFISTASELSDVVTMVSVAPHNLKVGERIFVKNCKDDDVNGTSTGLFDKGFNGSFTVASIVDDKTFTYTARDTEGVTHSIGNFTSDTTSLSAQTTASPRFERNDIKSNLYIYRNETITPFIKDTQDGIYHLFVLHADNAVSEEFTDLKYGQNVVDLYPQLDRDNNHSNPASSVSFAKRNPLGDVATDDLRKSITRETTDKVLKDFGYGRKVIGVTTTFSSANVGSATITFDRPHGFGAVKHPNSISAAGANYTNGTHLNVKLFNAGTTNWDGARATVIVSGGQVGVVTITEGGSGYTTETLDIDKQFIGGGSATQASITITSAHGSSGIATNIGDVVNLSGVGTATDGLYRIATIPSTTQISVALTATSPRPQIDQYALNVGPSIKISSETFSDPITTFVTSSGHGLVSGQKFKVIDGNNQNLGSFIVKTKISATSFTSNTTVDLGTPAFILPDGVASATPLSDKENENLGSRGLSFYDNDHFTLAANSNSGNLDELSVTLPNNGNASGISARFPIGSYLQAGDEIMRVKSTSVTGGNVIKVIRSALGTPQQAHLSGDPVRKITPRAIEFRRPSIIRASGHTFEYLGFGPGNYSTALPQVQVRTLSEREEFLVQSQERSCGTVVYTGMNNRGDFFIGNKRVSSATGQERTFDAPIATVTGEDPSRLSVIFDEVIIKERLVVEGGKSNTILTQFDGPVTFNKLVKINEDLTVNGIMKLNNTFEITDTTQSTSKDTGCLVLEGGLGVEKNLNVGGAFKSNGNIIGLGDLSATGDLDIDGGATIDGNTTIGNNSTDNHAFNGTVTFNNLVNLSGGIDVRNVNIAETNAQTIDTDAGDLVLDAFSNNVQVNANLSVQSNLSAARLDIDNVRISGNTVSCTQTNSNLNLSANGTGIVDVQDTLEVSGLKFQGVSEIYTSVDTDLSTVSSNHDTLVSAKAVKASIDGIDTELTIAADSGTSDVVTLGTDTLTFEGTLNEIETTVTNNKITIGLPNNIGIAGNLIVNGGANIKGNVTLGDASSDIVTISGVVDSALVPRTDDQHNLGTASLQWKNLFINGTANIDSLLANTVDIDGGNIDSTAIGAANPSSAIFTTLRVDSTQLDGNKLETVVGNINLTLKAHGTGKVNVQSDLDVDNNLNVDGNAQIDGTLNVDSNAQFDSDLVVDGVFRTDNVRIQNNKIDTTTGSLQLDADNNIVEVIADISQTGNFSTTGDVTALTSDMRLKTDIKPIKDALDKIVRSNLHGFTYRHNEVAGDLGFDTETRYAGVSAQDLQRILPEAVKKCPASDEYLTVQYEKIVPLLIEAIKELDDKCSQAARSFGQEIKHLHSVIEKLGVENSRLKGQEED